MIKFKEWLNKGYNLPAMIICPIVLFVSFGGLMGW